MAYSTINPDRSERVLYDHTEYPVYIRKGFLSAYPNYAAESHWHDDIELILILSGQMQYNVNGEIVTLKQGEGIFINARQLHFGFSDKKSECIFLCVLFHPLLICTSKTSEQKYVTPLISNEHIPFYHLKEQNEWEKNILSSVQELYNVRNDNLSELKIQRAFLNIWIALCENGISVQKEQIAKHHHLSALKDMISFINENYSEKLTLKNIATAGKVGKTGCCTIFKKHINKTPNEYLTELRLRKSLSLLKQTDMTVSEISCVVGFSGASYFAETFRKFYACKPSDYRKQVQKSRRKNP